MDNLQQEVERLRNGIQFIMNETQDDEVWDYLNHLLRGTESQAMINRFTKNEDGIYTYQNNISIDFEA